ncbi:MAG: polyketide synthase, partial [Oscillospiraceae bacterium]|nr:polyketide synthase [Oscillospiraceae bacterium]
MDNIAIIGMGCLYPNYVTKKDFWQKLINGENFLLEEQYGDRKIERGAIPADRSEEFFMQYFNKEEYDELDSYGELFKWIMYITKEALGESGYLNNREVLKRCGMVMGAFGMPAAEHVYDFTDLLKTTVDVTIKEFLGKDAYEFQASQFDKELKPESILVDTEPQRLICEKLGISGPIVTLNAACSTPVFTMKEAIMYLQEGKADMMLAGAQCYNEMDFAISGMFDLLGILSSPGENKPLDKASQGVIGGSGTGMFVLKRLEDAMRDNDKILGVIESIGWSSDGITKFILAPDAEGQIRSYEDAYKDGISPNVDYIECHATGTMAGDVVEIDSINKFFRKKGYDPLLGALKGNTG